MPVLDVIANRLLESSMKGGFRRPLRDTRATQSGLQICIGAKNRPRSGFECFRDLTWLVPGGSGHDSSELWERHRKTLTMTARNYGNYIVEL